MTDKFLMILPDRSCLRITGADKKQFLQGLVTNDIELLSSNTSIYTCFLTPQGRFVLDFFVVQMPEDDAYWIEGPSHLLDSFMMQLKLYKLRSDVQIEKVANAQVGVTLSENNMSALPNVFSYRDSRFSGLGYRFIMQNSEPIEQIGSVDQYEDFCLSYGIPQIGRDLVPNQTYILEAHLDRLNGVSFEKGCYLGQELTARMKYRGLLKRVLYPFKLIEGRPLLDLQLIKGDKELGKITNLSAHFGMAFIAINEVTKILTESSGRLEQDDFIIEFFEPVWLF